MQAGDLADDQLADILRTLAAAAATGGLHVRRRDEYGESADAVLFLRDGQLYAASAPGPRPLLGVRLVAAGAVTREALEEALESQAGELAGWRLGELLVHLGYVDADIVAEFVVEQILDTVAEVSVWTAGGWRFRPGEKTREADGLALAIDEVLDRVAARRLSWNDLEQYAGGAAAVPERVSYDEDLAAGQIPLARALLADIDGYRTLAELATRCGLTTYEAGYVLAQLVEAGTVQLVGQADPIPPVATVPLPPPPVDEPTAEVDLAMQLAVLARQAEEARWAAEAHRREQITARRTAALHAPAGGEPAAASSQAPIGLAPVGDWAGPPSEDPLGTPPPAPVTPIGLAPIGLAPIEAYGTTAPDPPTPLDHRAEQSFIEAPPLEPFPPQFPGVEPTATPPAAAEEVLPTREVSANAAAAESPVPTQDAMASLANLADLVGAIDLAALDDATAQPYGAADPSPEAPAQPEPAEPPVLDAPTWNGGDFAPAVDADERDSIRATLSELGKATALDPALQALSGLAEVATAQFPTQPPVWDEHPVTGFAPDLGDAHAQADTAALLRELSFLGVDDVPPPAPSHRPAPRAAPPRPVPASLGSAKPKRKSIFGR